MEMKGEERKMETGKTRGFTSSGVAPTQPEKEIEKYLVGWSDAATLDVDSYAMRVCLTQASVKEACKRNEHGSDASANWLLAPILIVINSNK